MEQYIGEIRIFAGNYAPQGWQLCNGQLLPISTNQALFTLMGTQFGGDGVSTFGLPNLQGRLVVGQGQGPGLSQYAFASSAGVEGVTLTEAQLGPHNHPVLVSTAVGTESSPVNNVPAQASDGFTFYSTTTATGFASVDMDPNMLQPFGGNMPHTNLMPSMALSYIIATEGIFPSQS